MILEVFSSLNDSVILRLIATGGWTRADR